MNLSNKISSSFEISGSAIGKPLLHQEPLYDVYTVKDQNNFILTGQSRVFEDLHEQDQGNADITVIILNNEQSILDFGANLDSVPLSPLNLFSTLKKTKTPQKNGKVSPQVIINNITQMTKGQKPLVRSSLQLQKMKQMQKQFNSRIINSSKLQNEQKFVNCMKSVGTGQSPSDQIKIISNPQDPENAQSPNKSDGSTPSQRIVTYSKVQNQSLIQNQSESDIQMFDYNFKSYSNNPVPMNISSSSQQSENDCYGLQQKNQHQLKQNLAQKRRNSSNTKPVNEMRLNAKPIFKPYSSKSSFVTKKRKSISGFNQSCSLIPATFNREHSSSSHFLQTNMVKGLKLGVEKQNISSRNLRDSLDSIRKVCVKEKQNSLRQEQQKLMSATAYGFNTQNNRNRSFSKRSGSHARVNSNPIRQIYGNQTIKFQSYNQIQGHKKQISSEQFAHIQTKPMTKNQKQIQFITAKINMQN